MEDLQRDLGRLEGTVDAQGERLDELDHKMEKYHTSNSEKLDRIIAFQEQQKGAGRIGLILSAGLGSMAGLLVTWFKT